MTDLPKNTGGNFTAGSKFEPSTGGFIEFEAPVVDYVKFAGNFWVYLANSKIYNSTDGMRFYEVEVTVKRLKK